jgi:hypothetical protein
MAGAGRHDFAGCVKGTVVILHFRSSFWVQRCKVYGPRPRRGGNASSAAMHKLRLLPPSDVEAYTGIGGVVWVKGQSGGISTFDAPHPGWSGKVWRAPAGSPLPAGLAVWTDGGGHWLWGPAEDMRYSDYCQALEAANALFFRV